MTFLSVWTDGLPSNLIAEGIGLVASIIATYLVVDRIISVASRRHHQPLRERLQREVAQNLAAMAHLWAYEFEEVRASELARSYDQGHSQRITAYTSMVEDNITELEVSATARQAFLDHHGSEEAFELARETVDNVRAISAIANRVTQVVSDDLELQSRLTDLEGSARKLDHVHSFAAYSLKVKKDGDAPLDLLLLQTIQTYRDAVGLWRHLEEEEAKS